jgi:hypothetical protein
MASEESRSSFRGEEAATIFTKFTALCYTQPIIPTRKWTPELKQLKVPITYIDQAIPSPPGMLAYEKLFHVDKVNPRKMVDEYENVLAMMKNDGGADMPAADPLIDITGERVLGHASLVDVSYELQCQRKYLRGQSYEFLPAQFDTDHRRRIAKGLTPNHQRKGLFLAASTFQRMAVHAHREFCDVVAKELIPRVSLEDKTTNKGSGDVVMKFLLNRMVSWQIRHASQQTQRQFLSRRRSPWWAGKTATLQSIRLSRLSICVRRTL